MELIALIAGYLKEHAFVARTVTGPSTGTNDYKWSALDGNLCYVYRYRPNGCGAGGGGGGGGEEEEEN